MKAQSLVSNAVSLAIFSVSAKYVGPLAVPVVNQLICSFQLASSDMTRKLKYETQKLCTLFSNVCKSCC
jgi:hypothetical protein